MPCGPSSRPDARVFCALLLGEELGERVAAAVGSTLGPNPERSYRLPRPAGLHATLFFLGDASGEAIDSAAAALEERLGRLPAPALQLTVGGAFPARGRERVLWIGVRDTTPGRLEALHGAALDAFEPIAPSEVARDRARPFRPHVTVARPRDRRPRVPAGFHALDLELPWAPEEACLVESVRGEGPALYRPLERFRLQPRRP